MSFRSAKARLAIAALSLGIGAACAAPAAAIPGQSLADFRTWAASKKLLAGLKPGKDELSGWPSFALLSSDHGIAWRYSVLSDGKTIRRELLAVSTVGGEPGTEPIRQNGRGYGFTFFTSLYGNDVAADFRKAVLVAAFPGQNKQTTRYYRGKHFGYRTSGDSMGELVIETPAVFATDLALVRRCTKSPRDCAE